MQIGSRKVHVKMKYANEESKGSIVVLDSKTKEVICTKETVKTEA